MRPDLPRGTLPDAKPTLASSHWATDAELAGAPGIILAKSVEQIASAGALFFGRAPDGRYIGYVDDRHCLTVAGSRAGKGTSLIVPNLALYPGSVLCIDPKGENARVTAARRRRMGQKVYVLDPFGVSGEAESAVYNPLADLDPGNEAIIDDAALIAGSLIAEEGARDPHWNEAARELIKGLILYVTVDRPHGRAPTLVEMRRVIRDASRLDDALEAMRDAGERDELHGVIAGAASSFLGKPDREADSVLSTALRHTEFLDSPGMARVLGVPKDEDSGLRSLRQLRDSYRAAGGRAVTVYLCLPATRMALHARWLRLMVNLALALFEQDAQAHPETERHSRPPVLFLLDEFASLGAMPSLAVAAGLMAGYGVKLWPFLQDLSQLKAHYRESWETFIGNAGAQIFFGNTDRTTLDYVASRLGQVRVASSSRSLRRANTMATPDDENYTFSDSVTPLLSAYEFQRIFARAKQGGFAAALISGLEPAWLRKIDWFDDPALRKLLQLPSAPRQEGEAALRPSLWNRLTSP